MFKEQIRPAILLFIILSVITGVIYPLFVTGTAQTFFHKQSNGSLIYRDGKPIGSALIGQSFSDPGYFWGRPSATSPVPFNAAASSGSNLGSSNTALLDAVKTRIKLLKDADPDNKNPIPVDLVTSSASGLDPHISLAAAYYQIPRVAHARRSSKELVKKIMDQHTSGRFFGIIGEPVVNVVELNLALDQQTSCLAGRQAN
ncbi:MAG: potassium-transporting ATPase subunit KdpC [Candidatus Omnitrophica bacterium]|nr:potassium-transporting ATPase subunit KdpC [Candidatus Omnitrophota bacterium]